MNQIIENGGYRKNLKEVYNLSDQYKEKNISPGGSADKLVIKTEWGNKYVPTQTELKNRIQQLEKSIETLRSMVKE